MDVGDRHDDDHDGDDAVSAGDEVLDATPDPDDDEVFTDVIPRALDDALVAPASSAGAGEHTERLDLAELGVADVFDDELADIDDVTLVDLAPARERTRTISIPYVQLLAARSFLDVVAELRLAWSQPFHQPEVSP